LRYALIGTTWATAHMNAISSRAIAVTATFGCLPRATSRVTRWISRAAKTVKNPAGNDVPLHELPREAVREVILGQRADNFLELEILELVTKPPYKSVTVLRAELGPSTFKLNIVPR
jgi:hypothetical protein